MTQSVKPKIQKTVSIKWLEKKKKHYGKCVYRMLSIYNTQTHPAYASFILKSLVQFTFCISQESSFIIAVHFKVAKLLMCFLCASMNCHSNIFLFIVEYPSLYLAQC